MGGEQLYQSGLVVDPAASPLPARGADTFVVADLDTGEIIAAQNAHEQRPPASTLKMLTALTLLDQLDPESLLTATEEETAVEGSKVGLVSGSTYSAHNLFEGLFLISGNDAATGLANLNGGVPGTVAQMNAQAQRLQAYDTVVRNVHGLDHPEQLSSAYDLALIARAGLQHPEFARLAALSNSTFPGQGTDDPDQRWAFEIWNQNRLVRGGYDGGIGVKPGFTSQGGRTFAAAAERDGKRYLVTLLRIEGNTYNLGAEYLDWAFANGDRVRPVGSLVDPKRGAPASDAAVLVAERFDRSANGGQTAASGEQGGGILVPALLVVVVVVGAGGVIATRRYRRVSASRRGRPTGGPAASPPTAVDLGERRPDHPAEREPSLAGAGSGYRSPKGSRADYRRDGVTEPPPRRS